MSEEAITKQEVDINTQDKNTGKTALHRAIYEGDLVLVKQLLSKGANPEIQDKYGSSPLRVAVACSGFPSKKEKFEEYRLIIAHVLKKAVNDGCKNEKDQLDAIAVLGQKEDLQSEAVVFLQDIQASKTCSVKMKDALDKVLRHSSLNIKPAVPVRGSEVKATFSGDLLHSVAGFFAYTIKSLNGNQPAESKLQHLKIN